jgi:hypothetical protein
MIEEIDIWRTAKILIDAHGEEAAAHAALRSDHAIDDGLPEVAALWKRVWLAIEELQRQGRRTGEAMN